MTTSLTTPDVVQAAIEGVRDPALPLERRAELYVGLRVFRKLVDRALRSGEVRDLESNLVVAMDRAETRSMGPIRLTWKAIDPRYVCNDPDNWGDDGVQETLRSWDVDRYTAPDGTPWIRRIPEHWEVDTAALGAAMAAGDPAARELYGLIRDKGYRTESGRAATITVDEHWQEGTE